MKMLMNFLRFLRLLPSLLMAVIAALCWTILERRDEKRDRDKDP